LWIPDRAGDHELRVFAISNLHIPEILSPVSSSQVTIGGSPGSYPLIIGNRTFEVQYRLSSSDGILESMQVDVPSIAIIADVNAARHGP
jgi:hypothetical protein